MEKTFPFLARLSASARRELAQSVVTRRKGRQLLLRRGDDVDGAYFVSEGSLRVYYLTPDGKEATLYRIEPGHACVLSVMSSLQAEPYPAWVETGASGSAHFALPVAVLRRLVATEEAFRDFVFGSLSARVFELMRTLEEAGSDQMEIRVARYLARSAGSSLSVRASQASIAAELGTAREVVFRALHSLAERGLVRTGRVRVDVLDAARLRAFARVK